MGIIYKSTNRRNKKYYIGKTIGSLENRIIDHFEQCFKGSPTHFHRALFQEPDGFVWEILEDNIVTDNINIINDCETYWVKVLDSNNPEVGYNMTEGGDGGPINKNHPRKEEIYKKSSETRKRNGIPSWSKGVDMKKHFQSVYGELLGLEKYDEWAKKKGEKISKSKTGKKYSEAYRKALSLSHIGYKWTEKARENLSNSQLERWKLPEEIISKFITLYTKENYSINKLSREFNMSKNRVKNTLTRNGITLIKRINQYG